MEQANNQTTSEMYLITDQLDCSHVSMFVQEKFDLFHHHTSIRSIEKKTICDTHTKHAQYTMPNMHYTPCQIRTIHSRHTRQNKLTISHTTTLSTTHKFGDTLHTCMHTHTHAYTLGYYVPMFTQSEYDQSTTTSQERLVARWAHFALHSMYCLRCQLAPQLLLP